MASMERAVVFCGVDRELGHLPGMEAPTRRTNPVLDDHESGGSPERSTDVSDDPESRRSSIGVNIGV